MAQHMVYFLKSLLKGKGTVTLEDSVAFLTTLNIFLL